MATVNKDFRIKAGLVVEGANATVDGEDIITTGSTTDVLPEGTNNLYFTAQRAADAVSDEIDTAVSTAIDALDTDAIEEGETNLYFTNQRAIDAVGGSATDANTPDTVVKRDASGNFAATDVTVSEISVSDVGRIYEDDGDLVIASTVEGDDVVIEADDIRLNAVDDIFLTAGSTSDVYVRGPGNIYLVGPAIFAAENEDGLNADKVATHGYVDNAITNIDLTFNSDEITEGTTNLYFTDQRALDATSAAYDAAGAAATAQQNAEDYADGLAVNYEVAGAAAAAQSAAESYADSAVSALVNGAPELLDTLNELAAAINDDASFASTIATSIGEKQNTLTAGSNIDITADTISVTGLDAADISDFNTAALSATASAYDAAGAAATAEQNAKDYADTNFVLATDLPGQLDDYIPLTQKGAADGVATLDESGKVPATQLDIDVSGDITAAIDELTTDDIEEGTTNLYFTNTRAVDALEAVVPDFTAVEVNSLAKQVAASGLAASAKANTVLSWAKADFRSAKLLVKAKTSTHSQVSEVLVTLDSADNVAITEFAMVQTDGELATVTVDVSGTDVRVIVTTLGASTDYSVFGTLLV